MTVVGSRRKLTVVGVDFVGFCHNGRYWLDVSFGHCREIFDVAKELIYFLACPKVLKSATRCGDAVGKWRPRRVQWFEGSGGQKNAGEGSIDDE